VVGFGAAVFEQIERRPPLGDFAFQPKRLGVELVIGCSAPQCIAGAPGFFVDFSTRALIPLRIAKLGLTGAALHNECAIGSFLLSFGLQHQAFSRNTKPPEVCSRRGLFVSACRGEFLAVDDSAVTKDAAVFESPQLISNRRGRNTDYLCHLAQSRLWIAFFCGHNSQVSFVNTEHRIASN
jgi:hypothetical protein